MNDLNFYVRNLGRSWEPPVPDSSEQYFPKRWCKWCGVECDISHEEHCEKLQEKH